MVVAIINVDFIACETIFLVSNPKRVDDFCSFTFFVLLQKVLEQVVNADNGAPCSPRHSRKKQFVDMLKRNVNVHSSSTSKHHVETSAIALVKLCKASTYINLQHSNNNIFSLVQTVFNDLKVRHSS